MYTDFRKWSIALWVTGILLSIPCGAAFSQESVKDSKATPLAQSLKAKIDNIIASAAPSLGAQTQIGVAVRDAQNGKTLYQHNADTAFSVASNNKLITAAVAFDTLGQDYSFQTQLLGAPISSTGHIPGNLYLRGRGNPSFDAGDMAMLVQDLKSQGVVSIDGAIVVDNSYFDDENLPPHFGEQPDEDASFRTPIAATSYQFNTWTLKVRPALSGTGAARVSVFPRNSYIVLHSSVQTVSSGRTRIVRQTKEHNGKLMVTVSGQIRKEQRLRRFRKRIPDPLQFVGSCLRSALLDAGIRVRKPGISGGKPPLNALLLANHQSLPLAVLVRGMGKFSNNFVAELLLKVIGAKSLAQGQPASWDHALLAVQNTLDKMGLAKGSYRYENGSGLFDSSRFSPNQLLTILHYARQNFRWGPDFFASLAIAGTDGTMKNRLLGSPAQGLVRAKTGTLAHASALSGIAALHGNQPLLFSILINHFPKENIGHARELQNNIAEALVLSLSGK